MKIRQVFLLIATAVLFVPLSYGEEIKQFDPPHASITLDSNYCPKESSKISIPDQWQAMVKSAKLNCKLKKTDEGDESIEYVFNYSLKNASFHGFKVVGLKIFSSDHASSTEYILDKPFNAFKPWLKQNLQQLIKEGEEPTLGSQVEWRPNQRFYLKTSETGSIQAYAHPKDKTKTVVAYIFAD